MSYNNTIEKASKHVLKAQIFLKVADEIATTIARQAW